MLPAVNPIDLKSLQRQYEANPSSLSREDLQTLLYTNYGITPNQAPLQNQLVILTPFEQYCNIAMHTGDIGYDGQFYLPRYIPIFYAIKKRDADLINYYLLRYVNPQTDVQVLVRKAQEQKLYRAYVTMARTYYPYALNLLAKYFPDVIANNSQATRLATIFNQELDLINSIVSTNNQTRRRRELEISFSNLPQIVYDYLQLSCVLTSDFVILLTQLSNLINNLSNIKNYALLRVSLNILLNIDFDIDSALQMLDVNKNQVNSGFANRPLTIVSNTNMLLFFALTVLNGKVLDKLLPEKLDDSKNRSIISEVLYSIDYKISNIDLYDNIGFTIVCSKYLVNPMLYRNDIPIIELYSEISADQQNTWRFAKPQIYDPETAQRLAQVVNVGPYLDPITSLSKDLMIQFGLL